MCRVLPQWNLSLVLITLTRAPSSPSYWLHPSFWPRKCFSPLCSLQGPEKVNTMPSQQGVFSMTTNGNPSPCFLIQASFQRHNYAPKGHALWKAGYPCPPSPTGTTMLEDGYFYQSSPIWSTSPKLKTNARTTNCSLSPTRSATKETFTKTYCQVGSGSWSIRVDQEADPPLLQDRGWCCLWWMPGLTMSAHWWPQWAVWTQRTFCQPATSET